MQGTERACEISTNVKNVGKETQDWEQRNVGEMRGLDL